MLGFRGCRLGISYPELTEMQARAIFEAAIAMTNQGVQVFPADLDDDDEPDNYLGMGISQSTAKWAVPASAVFNIGCQIYGMVSSPNMKEIADANHAMFSPQPMFILGFFIPQVMIQGAWMYNLLQNREKRATMQYAPYFITGEVAIGLWMLFWNNKMFVPAGLCCVVNSFAQFYAMSQLPAMRNGHVLVNLVASMMGGIGVLDLLDSYGTAYLQGQTPGLATKLLTFSGFTALGATTNPVFGASLVFDAVALYFGQQGSWANWLGVTALTTTAGMLFKNFF